MVLKTWRPTGIFFALAAPLLYGLGIPLNKLLLAQVNPLFLLALLQLGGGLGVSIIYLLRQYWQPQQVRAQLQGQDWLWLGLSGSMGGVVASLLMMVGLNYTPGTTAALLANLEGVFTVLLAWVVFKDVFSWRVLWGMVAISLGGVVLGLEAEGVPIAHSQLWGMAAVVGACLAWAVSSNLSQKIAGRDPLQLVMARSLGAGMVNLLLAALASQIQPLPNGWALGQIGLTGFFTDGLVILCYVQALAALGAARTGAYFALAPFAGAGVAVLLLGEAVTLPLLVAAGFMLLGVGFCLSEAQPQPAEL